MPLREGGYTPLQDLPLSERLASDNQWQAHWYRHVATLAKGKSVLDAGAGTGYGLVIMRAGGVLVASGFDVAAISPDVPQADIANYPDDSWDWVTAIDVIEHVEDDVGFLANLVRVSREGVFFSTPNWNVSRAQNHYHVREYTPLELATLLDGMRYRIWVSNHVLEVTTREAFDPEETWHNFGIAIEK